VLAYADTHGRVVVVDAGSCSLLFRSAPLRSPRVLDWSSDGRLLLVADRDGLLVYGSAHRGWISTRATTGVRDAAFAPRGHRLALVLAREVLVLDGDRIDARPRRAFAGPGPFSEVLWSPDGMWLLVPWRDADQWIFVRARGGHGVRATSSITEQFAGSFPTLAGWCCSR
jgi:hypothetical protein